MEVSQQLRYVCEFGERRGTRREFQKMTVAWRFRQHVEDVILHHADMAVAAQIVSHGSVLPSCAALIRPLHIKRPSERQNLTRAENVTGQRRGRCDQRRGKWWP